MQQKVDATSEAFVEAHAATMSQTDFGSSASIPLSAIQCASGSVLNGLPDAILQKTKENAETSTPNATLASGSKDDTSSHIPLSAMRKTGTAVKPQNLVKFEDMGDDPFTTEAALASVSEGDDAPFQTPLSEVRKTRAAVKAEDPVKSEDACTDPLTTKAALASPSKKPLRTLPSAMRKVTKQRAHVRFEDMGELIGPVNTALAYLLYRAAGTPPSASARLPEASKISATLSELVPSPIPISVITDSR
ncbi:hypothetical protein PILCRDRAFT_3215 [Piloderma croceum F 1598]|uniref:Uncharacterized protein n=1 Tax=Piloderma croceum (strain F 1598) TaxID=765440 RepID=A0A0C3FUV4_PILCF|nr:hypothetical protein PILCRDRAFT_3215 [Piloderma croceum F 1598]